MKTLCHDCKQSSEVKTMTPVYGLPNAHRCADCMRERTAACAVMQEARGELRDSQRGHSKASAFRKRAKKGCAACGAELPSADMLCQSCREIGNKYWDREAVAG